MSKIGTHTRDLLNRIDFIPLLQRFNHNTLEELKNDMYTLYPWSPIISADDLAEYLTVRYPSSQLTFNVCTKVNSYRETYQEYTIMYRESNTMDVLKELASEIINRVDDDTLNELVSKFIKTISKDNGKGK